MSNTSSAASAGEEPVLIIDEVSELEEALYNGIDDKSWGTIAEETARILLIDPRWKPRFFSPRDGYWDEYAQPYKEVPGHTDPRNLPHYLLVGHNQVSAKRILNDSSDNE